MGTRMATPLGVGTQSQREGVRVVAIAVCDREKEKAEWRGEGLEGRLQLRDDSTGALHRLLLHITCALEQYSHFNRALQGKIGDQTILTVKKAHRTHPKDISTISERAEFSMEKYLIIHDCAVVTFSGKRSSKVSKSTESSFSMNCAAYPLFVRTASTISVPSVGQSRDAERREESKSVSARYF